MLCRLALRLALKNDSERDQVKKSSHDGDLCCVSGLCTSDEESDSEELVDELLPFQRDWKVISDDEEDNELEE